MKRKVKAIFIGASAGGVSAVQEILSALPAKIRLPIVVVQHLPADAVIDPHLVFGRSTQTRLEEAHEKSLIENGCVYFAPPSYHLLIEKDFTFSLSQDEAINFARPSIDVLFESAAFAYGVDTCGVLLTGANSDGAIGMQTIHKAGGITLVQDPNDASSPTMPKSALELFRPDFIGTLPQIAGFLTDLIRGDS